MIILPQYQSTGFQNPFQTLLVPLSLYVISLEPVIFHIYFPSYEWFVICILLVTIQHLRDIYQGQI